jgi:predicted negative regulator of RcsB-dependent stress response
MYNGDMDKAEKHFKLNTMSNPTMANGHDSYGDFLLEKGDKVGAKASFMKAFELDSDFTTSKEKADKIQ